MEKIEKRIQETTFDVEVQYCDPDDCTHDCKREGTNNCDVVITSLWQKYQENLIFCPCRFSYRDTFVFIHFSSVIIW